MTTLSDSITPSPDAGSAAAASLSREVSLSEMVELACAAYAKMSKHEKLLHDEAQRKSFMRSFMSEELTKTVVIPPAAASASPPAEVEELVQGLLGLETSARLSATHAQKASDSKYAKEMADFYQGAASALTSLSLRVRALEEALKPFVLEAERFHSHVRAFDGVQLPFASADLQRAIDVYRARTVLHGEGDQS
jgi:hypothetical protein